MNYDKIRIQGKRTVAQDTRIDRSLIQLEEQYFSLDNLRSSSEHEMIDYDPDYIISFEFADGSEWIGSIEDVEEVVPELFLRSNNFRSEGDDSNVLYFPAELPIRDYRNGGFLKRILKRLGLIKVPPAAMDRAVFKMAKKIDARICKEKGLFQIKSLQEWEKIDELPEVDQPVLLLLHGTISSVEKSFRGLLEDNDGLWKKVKETYGEHVYGFDHYTLSESPIKNTIQLIEKLPNSTQLHIMSTSRGGIIADLLTKCQESNETLGFRAYEIEKLEKEGEDENAEGLRRINHLIQNKSIVIPKCIRIAAPAYGTDLLSKRLDHFFNGLLFLLGRAIGGEINPIYASLKSLLLQVIESKSRPNALPGLHAMVPSTAFQSILNGKESRVSGSLYAIAGNSKVGDKFGHSVVTILSKLFFWKKNDFVVHTSSMSKGYLREEGNFLAEVNSASIDHFKYFKNKDSLAAIKVALQGEQEVILRHFKSLNIAEGERGVLLGLGEYNFDNVEGENPIAIVLPGIMGSHLSLNGDRIYIDLWNMARGHFVSRLGVEAQGVRASGAVRKYYRPLVKHLIREGYDCKVFPYDWRKSLKDAAKELSELVETYRNKYDQPIKIIAHSMGGLVVRRWMIEEEASWKTYIGREDSGLVLLGTPWNGSHLIVELLTGDLNRLEMISQLDLRHSKEEVLKTVNQYPGIYELLPLIESESSENINFEKASFWQDLRNHTELEKFPIPPEQCLAEFKNYKTKANKQKISDFKNIYYVAGTDDETTFAFEKDQNHFYKYIRYRTTVMGDGSVTWELGIPKDMPDNQVYYAPTTHMNLAKDDVNFKGIVDLLRNGTTYQIPKSYIRSEVGTRGTTAEVQDSTSVRPYSDDFLDRFFGIKENRDGDRGLLEMPPLEVSVVHGDLQFSDYPVITGHFKGDGIISAEGALNKILDGALEERRRISGNYPAEIGDNLILFSSGSSVKGGIVVGMGENEDLTSFQLRKTVEQAAIDYAFEQRDKGMAYDGVSTVCISSGYGELTIEDSLYAILLGIGKANKKIIENNNDLRPIKKLEVIELYEDIAREIYYALKRIELKYQQFNLRIPRSIKAKHGGQYRLPLDEDRNWWHHFTTQVKSTTEILEASGKVVRSKGFVFTSSTGKARVEEKTNISPNDVIEYLLDEMSATSKWDPELSKSLFEIVIPNGFKDIIRNHNNILWKLDTASASIPWEMFHDMITDEHPTFTEAGLIRQFIEKDPDGVRSIIRSNTALIIGDPIYDHPKLNQLENARLEAMRVVEMLGSYQVNSLIRKAPAEIFKALFNTEYKILHFAGHGIYDPKTEDAGIVVGNMKITSALINQLPNIPEFVFINCCQSGELDPEFDEYYRNRYRFASNIGHQFIKMGVEAVVVTGWSVADAPAELFARSFYQNMIDGYNFGEAVKMARKSCYDQYRESNTWGAYHCYGDPLYKFDHKKSKPKGDNNYVTLDEVVIDLRNELNRSFKAKEQQQKEVDARIKKIIEGAEKSGFQSEPEVIEKQAEIYHSLSMVDLALERYHELMSTNKAYYKVSALEQYCNLLVKQAVQKHQVKALETEEINECEETVLALLKIGKTVDRFNIIASMYKRMCSLRVNYLEDLKSMYENYDQAIQLCDEDSIEDYSYPLTGRLIAGFFLKGNKDRQTFKGRELNSTTIIDRIKKMLQFRKMEHQDFWKDIQYIQLITCELLFETKKKKIDELKQEIVSGYKKAWEKGGEYRHLISEIEHFEFLVRMLSRKSKEVHSTVPEVRTAVEEILGELKKLKGSY